MSFVDEDASAFIILVINDFGSWSWICWKSMRTLHRNWIRVSLSVMSLTRSALDHRTGGSSSLTHQMVDTTKLEISLRYVWIHYRTLECVDTMDCLTFSSVALSCRGKKRHKHFATRFTSNTSQVTRKRRSAAGLIMRNVLNDRILPLFFVFLVFGIPWKTTC